MSISRNLIGAASRTRSFLLHRISRRLAHQALVCPERNTYYPHLVSDPFLHRQRAHHHLLHLAARRQDLKLTAPARSSSFQSLRKRVPSGLQQTMITPACGSQSLKSMGSTPRRDVCFRITTTAWSLLEFNSRTLPSVPRRVLENGALEIITHARLAAPETE
jgi:hypothetical protein